MYDKLINNFRNGNLIFKINKINIDDYLKNNPDPFEVYLLAKFCQLDDFDNINNLKYEFDESILHKEAYRYFFSYKYLINLRNNFHPKGRIPLSHYVPLEAQPIILTDNKEPPKNLFEVVKNNKQLAIVGKAGSGKTFSLEKTLMECIENNDLTNYFPILVELKGISINGIDSCLDRFISQYSNGSIRFKTIRKYFPKKNLMFLFDGIDEIAHLDYNALKEKINNFLSEFNCKFIISSRPLSYFREDYILGLRAFNILNLNESQVNNIITNYFKKPEKINNFSYALKKNKRLSLLASNPLLLKLICETFIKNDKTPNNEGEVFDNFVNELEDRDLDREDIGIYELDFSKARRILEILAYKMHSDDLPYIDRKSFSEIIKNEVNKITPLKVISELITRGFIRNISQDKRRYDFVHQAWKTYFAACYLKNNYIHNFPNKIKELVEFTKWDEVFKILCGLVNEISFEMIIKSIAKWDICLAESCIGKSNKYNSQIEKNILVKLVELSLDKTTLPEIRNKCIQSLGESRSEKAINCLFILLKEDNYHIANSISHTAFNAIFKIKSEKAEKPLINIIVDKNADIYLRNRVASSLRFIPSEISIDSMISVFKNNKEDVLLRENLASTFCSFSNERVLYQLIKLIKNKNEPNRLRRSVAYSLGFIHSQEALDTLVSVLQNDVDICGAVADGLSLIGTDEAVNALINILKDKSKHPSIRAHSISALRGISNKNIMLDLIQILQDKNESVPIRCEAAFCLGGLYPKVVNESLIKELQDKTNPSKLREDIINALNIIGIMKSKYILIDIVKDISEVLSVRLSSINYLKEIINQSDETIFLNILENKKESDILRGQAVLCLGNVDSKKSIEPLFKILQDSKKTIIFRINAGISLSKICPLELSNVLIELFKDKNVPTDLKLYLLYSIDLSVINMIESELICLFKNKNEDSFIRGAAAYIIGKINSKRILYTLVESLDEADSFLQNKIMAVFRYFANDKALDVILNYLKSKEDNVVIYYLNEFFGLNYIYDENDSPNYNLSDLKSEEIIKYLFNTFLSTTNKDIKNKIYRLIEWIKEHSERRYLNILVGSDLT